MKWLRPTLYLLLYKKSTIFKLFDRTKVKYYSLRHFMLALNRIVMYRGFGIGEGPPLKKMRRAYVPSP